MFQFLNDFLLTCVYTTCVKCMGRPEEDIRFPKIRIILWATTWVMENRPWFFVGASKALACCAISLCFHYIFNGPVCQSTKYGSFFFKIALLWAKHQFPESLLNQVLIYVAFIFMRYTKRKNIGLILIKMK